MKKDECAVTKLKYLTWHKEEIMTAYPLLMSTLVLPLCFQEYQPVIALHSHF